MRVQIMPRIIFRLPSTISTANCQKNAKGPREFEMARFFGKRTWPFHSDQGTDCLLQQPRSKTATQPTLGADGDEVDALALDELEALTDVLHLVDLRQPLVHASHKLNGWVNQQHARAHSRKTVTHAHVALGRLG
jgi:hypothetical protein